MSVTQEYIEKLDMLPHRESMHYDETKGGGIYKRNYRDSDYHRHNGHYPYTVLKRLMTKYAGMEYDFIFSLYCQRVPQYQQKFFDTYLERKRVSNRRWSYFLIQGDKILVEHGKRDNIYTLRSYDLKYEDRLTGNCWKKNSTRERVIVQGWVKEYKVKDKAYRRDWYEAKTSNRKIKKQLQKAKRLAQYSFLSKDELRLKEEKEIDKYKILKHGFDLETSFRTEKQCNPDLIKQKQNDYTFSNS